MGDIVYLNRESPPVPQPTWTIVLVTGGFEFECLARVQAPTAEAALTKIAVPPRIGALIAIQGAMYVQFV